MKKHRQRLKLSGVLRRSSQIINLLIFIYLILYLKASFEESAYWVALPFATNIFYLQADPLLFSGVILSTKQLLPIDFRLMIGLIILTLLWGRFFCGWVCPVGTLFDLIARILPERRQNTAQKPGHHFKYFFLLLLLIVAITGLNLVGIVDPLTIFVSSFTYAVLPYADYLLRGILSLLYKIPFLLPITERIDASIYQEIMGVMQRQYQYGWIYFAIFLSLILLLLIQRRYWCRYLCPLGALLGFLARPSLFRRKVSEACTECGICAEHCRMNSIGVPAVANAHQECIMCLECRELCPVDAIRFSPFTAGDESGRFEDIPINYQRRYLIKTIVATALMLPIIKVVAESEEHSGGEYLLRPPGALPEDQFIKQCIRCGQCLRVCPENALHPTLFEAKFSGLWTPVLVPRLGYCAYNCNLCGKVCPTGAIEHLSINEKRKFVIGWAYFDHNRCLPWAQNIECSVCEEACPISPKAIILREENYVDDEGNVKLIKRPYVIESLCIGCGICENKCPLNGESAIRVKLVPAEVRRKVKLQIEE